MKRIQPQWVTNTFEYNTKVFVTHCGYVTPSWNRNPIWTDKARIIIILLKQDYKIQLANNKIQMALLTSCLVVR